MIVPRRQTSIESYGLGQSGYTAGRRDDDPALARIIETRNRSFPINCAENLIEHEDDRWAGRGGSWWYPKAA